MTELLLVTQIIFILILAMSLWGNRKGDHEKKATLENSASKKSEELAKLRGISLSEPLSEKTRPKTMNSVIGQSDGIAALTAALCGKNPQHILIYGPPGVGKTCAARLALELAKKSKGTPFAEDAKFIELDATCIRFDERSIADLLIGSVHDPIYQGAGSYGQAGVPQPKPGAVTKAHGGVLFLDEIGELHPVQMNKLLKVMEDRKVMFESAYYSEGDSSMPAYIHDVFQNGMPADFRLIGATTRRPEDLPAALRSRCIEVFFRPLYEDELMVIAQNAAQSGGIAISQEAARAAAEYAANGRDAVNIVQLALGLAYSKEKERIEKADIDWIINAGRYKRRCATGVSREYRVGVVNALGVSSDMQGYVFEIECSAIPCEKGKGALEITGFAEQEEVKGGSRCLIRKSTAIASIENVMTVLRKVTKIEILNYDIHVNASGGLLVDGPSAGLAIAMCVYSAVTEQPIAGDVAFTGEIGVLGGIKPVGGVKEKTEAARRCGVKTVYIPKGNAGEADAKLQEAVYVSHISEMDGLWKQKENTATLPLVEGAVSASPK